MKTLPILLSCGLAVLWGCTTRQEQFLSREVTVPELRQHVRYLASDELKGRKAGEEGNRIAAGYIANEFRRYGLTPAGDGGSYLQDFTFISSAKEGDSNSAAIALRGAALRYVLDSDFKTLAYSPETTITAPLVFAGYGISSADSVRYDDYAGVDVKGKAVIVLRYSPDGPGMNRFTKRSDLMAKTFTARDKGAAAIIFVTAAPGKEGYSITSLQAPPSINSGIPAVVMRWAAIDSLFALEGKSLAAIQTSIDSTKIPSSFEVADASIRLQTTIVKIVAHTANILGYLPGSDPMLGKQILVIGAHMDHLGMGVPARDPASPTRVRSTMVRMTTRRGRQGCSNLPSTLPHGRLPLAAASSSHPSPRRNSARSGRSITSTIRSVRSTVPSPCSTWI